MTQSTNAMRKVRPRVRSGPVNRSFIVAGACFAVAAWTAPDPQSGGIQRFYHWLSITCGAVCTAQGLRLLARDYRTRRDLAISERLTDDHGSARQSSAAERAARGMRVFEHGELLGLDDKGRPVWRPAKAPFMLWESPPGGFRTVAGVMGSIMHRAQLGFSVMVPDIKEELAVMLARKLRGRGHEVWIISPSRHHTDLVGETAVNPYQPVLDALYGNDEERKDAVKLAAEFAGIHYPIKGDEKNPYFAHGSRRAILIVILSTAVIDPARCTPTAVYRLLADPAAFLKRCEEIDEAWQSPRGRDPVLEVLKTEARNMLHRAAKNEENFASFLEGASQRLLTFNPAGHLGDYGREAIHNLKAIRERQIIVFIMAPLSHMRDFADFISLVNHNIIAACKAVPAGHPVHIVGEEALNYRFHDLVSDLETMRQLGVTADFYIQSFVGLELRYGKEAAAAIEAYSDVRVYAGLNSLARAKHVSDQLSNATIRTQDYSYRTSVDQISLSSREIGRPLMKPDEVLAMPRDEAWVFVRGMHPVRVKLVHYGQVAPWRDWVDESPITGTKLYGAPIVHVDYPEKESGIGRP
ncbi:type IV secretory system conjugative DNA transfer family protein [Roseomonas frigidaquae]|uniref:Type IV secretory system conjugative DNA transfer family protein n=1 Tax=Falsiroseomonas frigidaquae TaxID=487318 RepID=A0ABX1F8C5_9PROT|nr:type IV secretory system conjugative DNA transfer family protein [Falsiroseomonas frigidaquae]NKE48641.1 type IV secretory system conjugative DNA transfer family protein [Falsiroseomonas frigidaquae]